MPAAASTAAAPKYSDDMTVDEILSLMTEEEAAELDSGSEAAAPPLNACSRLMASETLSVCWVGTATC